MGEERLQDGTSVGQSASSSSRRKGTAGDKRQSSVSDATTITFHHKISIPLAPCMASSTISRKRKRGAEDGEKVALQLSSEPTSKVGPVLGTSIAQIAAEDSDSSHRFVQQAFHHSSRLRLLRSSVTRRRAGIKTRCSRRNRLLSQVKRRRWNSSLQMALFSQQAAGVSAALSNKPLY